ncbi:MAG: GNAT family N-acetyltransferase [Mycobacterium sp.]
MVSWPAVGTRVTVRYRRPTGSVPPLTDAVGHLLAVAPTVRVRTKTGAVAEFAPDDVVALRVLTDAPVRTSQIRALEHAAAAAWPATEHTWLDGWLLRAGDGATLATNSAVPLDISASADTIPSIVTWYTRRNLTPRLAIPDRLLRLPAGLAAEREEHVLVRDVTAPDSSPEGHANAPLDNQRDASVTFAAVIDGELIFGAQPGAAVARAAVTDAPDGTRWVGLSVLRAVDDASERRLCEALLAWGARRGATRGYLRVENHDSGTTAVARYLGFRMHHRSRYFPAQLGGWATV